MNFSAIRMARASSSREGFSELGDHHGIEVNGEAVDIYRPQVLLPYLASPFARLKAQVGDLWCAVANGNLDDEIRAADAVSPLLDPTWHLDTV